MCRGGKVTGTIIKFDRTIYTNSFFDIATYGVLTFFCPFVFSSFFFCPFLWLKHTPSIITHILHTSPRLNHVQPVDHRSLPSFLAIPFFFRFSFVFYHVELSILKAKMMVGFLFVRVSAGLIVSQSQLLYWSQWPFKSTTVSFLPHARNVCTTHNNKLSGIDWCNQYHPSPPSTNSYRVNISC